MPSYDASTVLLLPSVIECLERGFILVDKGQVTYQLNQKRTYNWADPEEWVRCATIAFLIIDKQYPSNRIRVEVQVPRRVPSDLADIVVYSDDQCRSPYLVVENKAGGQSAAARMQAVEQLFGNANSLRCPLALYDEDDVSTLFDVANFPSMERATNRRGDRNLVPAQYGNTPIYGLVAGTTLDIQAVSKSALEAKIKRAHSLIWAGGKRDPLMAFDEWSKLLFAKVHDERRTPNGAARAFQVGSGETTSAVATRIHKRFEQARTQDPTVFQSHARINLPDRKIFDVVQVLQNTSFMMTDTDTIGSAFESFFGSVFRGELGQYFTQRQLARFVISAMDVGEPDYCIDPTAGSGGFLLEALLQVWHRIDREFAGQPEIERTKMDFALHRLYGIEIHDILARICKINLILHHDGHTNVEGDRSCLDSTFALPRLNPPRKKFTKIFGNPPFGDEVRSGDEDLLGENDLDSFLIARARDQVASEHVILERCIDLLEQSSDSRLGLILPDGIFNNQGEQSNCPNVRRMLARRGVIEAIISLPDHAFRKSGAQNKTSILLFRRFTKLEQAQFDGVVQASIDSGGDEDQGIANALGQFPYRIFFSEANHVGYTSTGLPSEQNDLYIGQVGGQVALDQHGTILGEYRKFRSSPETYEGISSPDCMSAAARDVWLSHNSHRLDPKYHLFKKQESATLPEGWRRKPVRELMRRREDAADPASAPDVPVKVITIGQTGEIRPREAGKGRNPPEWLGMYFVDSASSWFRASAGDLVFSSIDLWKGCVAIVPPDMDGALVTKEFPIYQVTDPELDPAFLSGLLRTRYYQRAFRAITTGHSNRRRTQVEDFESLEIVYPATRNEQLRLIKDIQSARDGQKQEIERGKAAMLVLSNVIDGRGQEELPEVDSQVDSE